MKGINYLFFIVLGLSTLGVSGQTLSSTYSDQGIGLLNYQGLPNNMAMGEVGYALPSSWNMQFQNPAFLPFNRFSMFQVGVAMDRRTMTGPSVNAKRVAGGLRFLNYAFPIVNGKWTSSFGLTPFSSSSVKKYSIEEQADGTTEITQLTNSGGLASFQWGNGFRLSENIYAGVKFSLLFGSLNYEETQTLDDSDSFTSKLTDELSYSGVRTEVGLGYTKPIGDDRRFSLGLVYGLEKDIMGTRNFVHRSELSESTTSFDEVISFKMPSTLGVGVSYQFLNKWAVASDLTLSNWKNGGAAADSFMNTTKIGLGAEWTPDYASISNYWRRVTYRVGVNMEQLPYTVQGETISELGINFGGSFPIGVSNLDTAFKYGVLGGSTNQIRETYFRIVIGATINDRWFIKRRYD